MRIYKSLLPLLLLLLSSCASVNLSGYTGAGRSFEADARTQVDYGVSVGGPITIGGQSFYGYGGYNPVFNTGGIGISKGFTVWRNKSERHNKVNKQSHNQRTNELNKFYKLDVEINKDSLRR